MMVTPEQSLCVNLSLAIVYMQEEHSAMGDGDA